MGNYISHPYIFCPPSHSLSASDYQSILQQSSTNTLTTTLYNIPVTTCYSSIEHKAFVTEIKIKGAKKAIVWSYGNACDMYGMLPILINIAQTLQTTIYLYDYPGYGLSEGTPSESACINTLAAVVQSAMSRNQITAQQLILIGQSLGSAITVGFAYKNRGTIIPCQIILLSPFKTAASVVSAHYMTENIYKMLGGDTFATINKIAHIVTPIKIYHGKLDTLIPFQHSIALQKVHRRTRLILLPYANHNNMLEHINIITLFD